MARLPGGEWLIQTIGEDVVIFRQYTEEELVRFPMNDANRVAQAQKVIFDSNLLTDEQKCFAHFWSGYFYASSSYQYRYNHMN